MEAKESAEEVTMPDIDPEIKLKAQGNSPGPDAVQKAPGPHQSSRGGRREKHLGHVLRHPLTAGYFRMIG